MIRSLAIAFAFLLFPLVSQADPLACIPKHAGVVIKIEEPRALVESAAQLDAWKGLQNFPQVKEVLDSTDVRRFFQLLSFVEAQTGHRWPDLIEKVAGRGIALGFKTGEDEVLAVIEGTDEATVKKVYAIFLAGIRDEATRDIKLRLLETNYAGVVVYSLGDDLHYARAGTRLLFSNRLAELKVGLDLALNNTGVSILTHKTLKPAQELIGKAAAWLWFDLAAAKATDAGKDFFKNARKEIAQLFIYGSTVDAAGRSDFVAAGLYLKPGGYSISVRLPAGRAGLHEMQQVHVPSAGVGSKPLLEPPGVVFSQSLYLDFGHAWANRKSFFIDKKELEEMEKGVAEVSRLLPGTSVEKLLLNSGPYHRVVMAHTGEKLYTREPGVPIPPAAYVLSLKDSSVGESLEGMLMAGGMIAAFQTGWTFSKETIDGVKIVTYKFPENAKSSFTEDDEDNVRFNAMPSFARVGDSLVVGSTPGIVKALIPILKKESAAAGAPEVWKLKVYARGAADVLAAFPDATVTDAILTQGVTLAEARKQTQELSKWIQSLGTATITIDHGEKHYQLDIEWQYKTGSRRLQSAK